MHPWRKVLDKSPDCHCLYYLMCQTVVNIQFITNLFNFLSSTLILLKVVDNLVGAPQHLSYIRVQQALLFTRLSVWYTIKVYFSGINKRVFHSLFGTAKAIQYCNEKNTHIHQGTWKQQPATNIGYIWVLHLARLWCGHHPALQTNQKSHGLIHYGLTLKVKKDVVFLMWTTAISCVLPLQQPQQVTHHTSPAHEKTFTYYLW